MRILFITWDGPQVSYLEGLFLPIFTRLKDVGLDFHILQFTWGDAACIERNQQACHEAGITYECEKIIRKPLAIGSVLTAVKGARKIRQIIKKHRIDSVMPRSTLPAMATLLALRGSALPIIFDADGLPLDERVDFSGLSSSGLTYRFLRDVEAQAVRRANIVLTRSRQAIPILQARAGAGTLVNKFWVVRNGRDTHVYAPGDESSREKIRQQIGVSNESPLLVYAGSVGPQYCLNEMLRLFSFVYKRRSDSRLLVLTGAANAMTAALDLFPHLKLVVDTRYADPLDVPKYMACADLGLALRRQSFSMQAVAPIKLGEYLLCGLPVVASDGIGDTESLMGQKGAYLTKKMNDAQLEDVASWFLDVVLIERDAFRKRCRAAGIEGFSLDTAVDDYRQAFLSV